MRSVQRAVDRAQCAVRSAQCAVTQYAVDSGQCAVRCAQRAIASAGSLAAESRQPPQASVQIYIYIYIYICIFICVYIYVYIYIYILLRGNHLSNTTCLTQAFFKLCESCVANSGSRARQVMP